MVDPGIPAWSAALMREVRLPGGLAQSETHQTNAGVMSFPDGLVGVTGDQTAGDSKPYLVLPAGKVPSAAAIAGTPYFVATTNVN